MLTTPNATRAALRQALLSPRSVAIVGQSDDATKTAGAAAEIPAPGGVCRDDLFRQCQGARRCWASAPTPPSPRCPRRRTTPTSWCRPKPWSTRSPNAAGRASGSPPSWRPASPRPARTAWRASSACREIAAETGIRIIGPSSLGVVNLREGLLLTANAAFAEPDIPVGRTFFASHSGTMIGALMSRGKARGVGFAGLVSIGNEVDLSVGEICAATLDDPGHRRLPAVPRKHPQCGRAARIRARRGGARQAGRRLQARPLVGGARACRHPHRRARRRGRCGERVPRRLRHRARRKPRRR